MQKKFHHRALEMELSDCVEFPPGRFVLAAILGGSSQLVSS